MNVYILPGFTLLLAILYGITIKIQSDLKLKNNLAAYKCTNKDNKDPEIFNNMTNIKYECFFSENYTAARELFLYNAKSIGAEMLFMPVVGDLGNDVAVIRGIHKSNNILLFFFWAFWVFLQFKISIFQCTSNDIDLCHMLKHLYLYVSTTARTTT